MEKTIDTIARLRIIRPPPKDLTIVFSLRRDYRKHFIFLSVAFEFESNDVISMEIEYVDLLVGEYVRRKNTNPAYSERAFARSIKVSPGFLKLLFQKKKRLSIKRAADVAMRLGWDEGKKKAFIKSIQYNEFKRGGHLRNKQILSAQSFFEISDWYHFAIIELIKTHSGSVSIEQIASSLGLSKTQTQFAVKNLLKNDVIEEASAGAYRVPGNYEIPSMSSGAIRKYHKQTNELAIAALENQPFETRDFRGLTLAFEKDKIDEAKREIAKFIAAFEKKFGNGDLDSVYQMNLSFFQLNKEDK